MKVPAESAALPARDLIGGRFIVEDQLGRGGMALVYRVRDAKSGERFALKRAWGSNPTQVVRRGALLEREFYTLAHLRHPRIIEVYEYGVDVDGPYYTMELLDGADLDRDGRLPWLEACAILRDVASSLSILHSRGLLHRDVSARNVRRTADGRVKLIDFGGMASMGIASDVIGTPPFMAPEVLQMQSLDARADLYSLGALGYTLLTGRHAFRARSTRELRDAWRSRPAPPSRAFPEIPAALSALVMQLLALDRGARPHTAAEVMERLCVLAELPKEELPEIARGYLTTPMLVGRDATLLTIRRRMLSVVRREGGALLLEGPAGSGRSRLLDACVFEGNLQNAVVVRSNLADATEPWGVARAVATRLYSLLPEASIDVTRLSASVLAHLIDELRPENDSYDTVTVPERSVVLRELRDYVLALATKHRLLLVIDDADRIDEPSMAWLSALIAKAERHGLLVVAAAESDDASGRASSLELFRSLADRLSLPPLDAEQTEALMRSVFGEASNLSLIAGRIHAVAQGNPRAIMELAEHMVDRGWARYEAGSWLLPPELDPSDLPATLSDSLARRLAGLGKDACDLAEVLSIAETDFPLAVYRELTRHRDPERMFAAFDELVSARVLVASVDRYRFSQRSFSAVLQANMPASRREALHRAVADVLSRTAGDLVQRAHHLCAAGRLADMATLLCGTDLMARLPPLPLLERAVEYAEQSASLPARAVQRLRLALLGKAALLLEANTFRRHLPVALKQLERDSGLELYRELESLPESERLQQALTQQQQRYLALPEREQVNAVGDAVRQLGRLAGATCSHAAAVYDLEVLEGLPSLEPLLPLSPALGIATQLVAGVRHWLSGRAERGLQVFEAVLARLAESDRAGLDAIHFERTLLGVHYLIGHYEAQLGMDRAEQRAQRLERRRELRVNAWRLRSLLLLSQGDADGARKATRRAELLMLQDESEQHYANSGIGLYILACFQAEDLIGVKQWLDAMTLHADRHPGWQPMCMFGQSCYRYLSGDLVGALETVEQALTITLPGRHLGWGVLAAQRIRVLRDLGQNDRALEHAQAYVERARRDELTHGERFIRMECARSLAVAGRHAEALVIIESLLQRLEALGARGLALGVFYEARASIALTMRDRSAFEQYAQLCAREYERGKNPALSAKFARLMDEARQLGLSAAETLPFEASLHHTSERPPRTEEHTVVSRMLECVDGPDRARCALTMLLQSTDSYLGHLYGVRDGRLLALAGLPTASADSDVERWLSGWFEVQCELATREAAMVTISGEAESMTQDAGAQTLDGDGPPAEYTDPEGRCFYPVLLVDQPFAERKIAGLLLLQVEGGRRRRPPLPLCAHVANQLLAHGDVQGIAVVEPPELSPREG